jgi:dipeptidyl aminopeptidase/acylaminoacyl peptidase
MTRESVPTDASVAAAPDTAAGVGSALVERDIRGTPVYRETESFFRSCLEPGFGRVTSLGDPEPSPDGRWIAFEGSVLEALEGHAHERICLAAADGTGWRTITHGPGDDTGPRWSPDGTTLTFVSDRVRKGRGQLYALDAGSIGEGRALTVLPGVVEHHRWSPDGTRILAVVAGEKAEQSDARGSGTFGDERGDEPDWLPDVASSDDEEEWRSLWVIDVATGGTTRASRDGVNVWEATWLGDGAAVAVVSDAPGEGAWYQAALAVMDLAGGQERILYRGDVQLEFAEGSPDGTTVAVLEAVCSDRYVIAGDLLVIDVATGAVTRPAVPGDVSSVRWRGDRLLVAGLDRLDATVAEVDPRSGVTQELWRTAETISTFFQPAAAPLGSGGAFACVQHSVRRAPELLVVEDGAAKVLAETRHAGTEVRTATLGERRVLTWAAPDGWEIDGHLLLPEGEPPFPLLLDVHGGPIGAVTDGFLGIADAMLLARGYALLAPNPRGSTGRGRAFAAAVVGDMGGADALDDLAGVDAVVAMGLADPARIGVIGGSYGGFMAAWLPVIDPRFAVAISISPVTDWYSEHFNSSLTDWVGGFLDAIPEEPGGDHHARSPVFGGERLRTPTLLTAGLRDRATPPGQAIEMYRALRARGVAAELAVYPLEGHGVRDLPAAIDVTARMLAFLDRHMPGR